MIHPAWVVQRAGSSITNLDVVSSNLTPPIDGIEMIDVLAGGLEVYDTLSTAFDCSPRNFLGCVDGSYIASGASDVGSNPTLPV